MEIGAFSISLAHTGRIPHREAASGKTPIPSKRLPSLISGTVRGTLPLHVHNAFQRGRRNPIPGGNRNIIFHVLVHSPAADKKHTGAFEHIPAHVDTVLVFLRHAVIEDQRKVQLRADRGKARFIGCPAELHGKVGVHLGNTTPCGGDVC